MEPIETLVPNQPPIELIAYYPSFAQYYPECELQTKRWFVDHVGPDWVMFDAGANIGYYSILFSRLAPHGKIFAFEPTVSIDLLRENLAHHGCRNVTPIQVALGSASGPREDSVYRIWGEEPERRVFEFATVDEMIFRLDLRRLDCIKIDVDSFDLDVLRGAEATLLQYDPWVVVEISDALTKRNQSSREALEWLYSLGYRHAHITDDENYIFRRREYPEKNKQVFPSMLLSFETQPLIVPLPWRNGDAIDGVFEKEPRRHNTSSIFSVNAEGGPESWNITVPGPRWSYAVSWPRTARELPSTPVIIQVDIDVSGGLVGVGCINADETGYVGVELELRHHAATQRITLLASRGTDIGYVVVRNVDPNGALANVRIHSVRVYNAVSQSVPTSGLLSSQKRRIALTECAAALVGDEPSKDSPADVAGIDIVPISELGHALGFDTAFIPEIRIYRHGLVDFTSEVDESAMFRYLYREFQPRRHLEIGTEVRFETITCALANGAEVWAVEAGSTGSALPSDVGQNREGASASRIHRYSPEIFDLEAQLLPEASFDSVLIGGRLSADDVAKHTKAALRLLRPGGLLIWHAFCPNVEALRRHEAVRNCVAAVVQYYSTWRPQLRQWFWIRPSWILGGIKE